MIAALWLTAGFCEESVSAALDLSALEALGEANGIGFRALVLRLLSGEAVDAGELSQLGGQLIRRVTADLPGLFGALAVSVIVSAGMRLILGGRGGAQAIGLTCRIACMAVILARFGSASEEARRLMEDMLACTDAITPVLAASMALSGADGAAAAYTPATAVCSALIQRIIAVWGPALASVAAGVATAGNMGGRIALTKLHGLIRRTANRSAALMIAGFTGFLSVQGRLAGMRDTPGSATARFAIESLLPIIGGNVSESLGALTVGAGAIRSAVGAAGLALLAAVSIVPVARIAAVGIALRLAGAVVEPVGESGLTAMFTQFADCFEMLATACGAAMLLCALTVGSGLGAFGLLAG